MTGVTEPFEAEQILDSFRQGTVSKQYAGQFMVGREFWVNALSEDLDFVAKGASKIRFLSAPYGGGKSHFLAAVEAVALEKGFLVANVELHSREAPLDKFEVIFPKIMRSLRSNESAQVLDEVFERWLESTPLYERQSIKEETRRISSSLDFQAALRAYVERADSDLPENRDIIESIFGWICGDAVSPLLRRNTRIRNRITPTNATEIFGSFLALVRQAGFSGLALFLDEAEAVTSLAQSRRRDEANQNLRKLLDNADSHKGYMMVFATTPAFLEDPKRGAQSYAALWGRFRWCDGGRCRQRTRKDAGCDEDWNVGCRQSPIGHEQPRTAQILEMYGDKVTADQIAMALGFGDGTEGENYTLSYSLKESIRADGRIVHPIIVNRESKDRLVVIEGNTCLQIYRDFNEEGVLGNWQKIPAVIHENLGGRSIDAIRLQAHLVGPRPWEPYSKAKYLSHLRNGKNLTLDQIVEFCGGRRKQILDYVAAFHDMEKHYRPRVMEAGATFDPTRFSGFVELQRPRVFNALAIGGFTKDDFAQCVIEELLMPLNSVRQLPRILDDEKAKEIFLEEGAVKAIKSLDVAPADATLVEASLSQLARELARRIAKLELREIQRMKSNPPQQARRNIAA